MARGRSRTATKATSKRTSALQVEAVPVSRSAMRRIGKQARRQFGKNLYRLMQAKGLSQSDLAKAAFGQVGDEAAKGRDRISKYIHGKAFPERDTLPMLCAALDCEIADLLSEQIVEELFTSGDVPVVVEVYGANKMRLRCDFVGDRQTVLEMLETLTAAAKRNGYEFGATPKNGGKS